MINFSVLISVYEKDDVNQFKRALDSIFQNTTKSKDVVLIVDGPVKKNLKNIIIIFKKKYHVLNVHYLAHNKGLANALNIGLRLCKYNIVFRADADDINKHDRFKKQLLIMNKGYDLVGSWIDEFNGDSYVSTRKVPENNKEIYRLARFRSPLNHQTVCFLKDKINKLGGYEDMPYHEDYLLWIKCIKAGYKINNIQEPLVNAEIGNGFIKRRSGLGYIFSGFRLNYRLYKYGINSLFIFLISIVMRFIFFMLPNFLKEILYKFVLRD